MKGASSCCKNRKLFGLKIDVSEDNKAISVFGPKKLAMLAQMLEQSAVQGNADSDIVAVHHGHILF